jgi:hypothetical protein
MDEISGLIEAVKFAVNRPINEASISDEVHKYMATKPTKKEDIPEIPWQLHSDNRPADLETYLESDLWGKGSKLYDDMAMPTYDNVFLIKGEGILLDDDAYYLVDTGGYDYARRIGKLGDSDEENVVKDYATLTGSMSDHAMRVAEKFEEALQMFGIKLYSVGKDEDNYTWVLSKKDMSDQELNNL